MASLDLGELRIALDLDDSGLDRGLAGAQAKMEGLSASAQREVVKVKSTFSDGGRDAGTAFGDGIGDGVRRSSSNIESTGNDASSALSRGMEQGLVRNSPMIAGAVSAALIAGAPAAIAGAGLLFGGIAAVAVHSNAQVSQAAQGMASEWKASVTDAAQVTVPMFSQALGRLGTEAQTLKGSMSAAFTALGGPIDSTTTGLINMTNNAMPGLVHAVQSAGPVFQGLASAMGSIGTGLGGFFDAIGAHAPAAGTAMAQIGNIVSTLLPVLGELVGEGAELAADVLPPVASALHVVAGAFHEVAPLLPAVATGFLAFKAIGALSGPLNGLAGKLNGLGTAGATAGGALSKLSSSLPVVGAILAGFTIGLERSNDQAQKWAQALLQGGQAADTARAQMSNFGSAMQATNTGVAGFLADLVGPTAQIGMTAHALQGVNDAQKAMLANMSPLQKAQQDVTSAQNDYSAAVERWGASSGQAVGAAAAMRDAQANLASQQAVVSTAMQGTTAAAQGNVTQLQAIANAASGADSQIQLLKGALDALTGTNMTADQAEIAVTQAVQAATQATQGMTGALVGANGQVDLHSQKGAAAAAALINLAGTQHQEIATLEQQGASMADVSARSDQLRGQFIQVAQQMGFTAQQAQNLADRYFGIPGQVHTTIAADDAATPVIARVQQALAALKDKTITVTTYNKMVSSGPLGAAQVPQAAGHIVHAYAGGGFESMPGGIAQIVPPNTWRVIGDRVRDDEAYIPINGSARSMAILAQTAARMGVALGGGMSAAGPQRVIYDQRTVNATAIDAAALAREMAAQQRDQEFLAGL